VARAVHRCEFALAQLQLVAESCAQHHQDAGWRAAAQQVLQLLSACWDDVCHLAASCTQMLKSSGEGGGGGERPGAVSPAAQGQQAGAAAAAPGPPAAGGPAAAGGCAAGALAAVGGAEEAPAGGSPPGAGGEDGRQQERLQRLLGFRASLGSRGICRVQELERLERRCVEALTSVLYSPRCMPVAAVPAELLAGQPALQRKAAAWQAVMMEQQQQQQQQQQRGGAAARWPQPLEVMPGCVVDLAAAYGQPGDAASPPAAAPAAASAGGPQQAAGPALVPVGLDLPFIQSQLELQADPAVRRLVQEQGLARLGAGVLQVLPALQLVRQELAGAQGRQSYACIRWGPVGGPPGPAAPGPPGSSRLPLAAA
jgi:hypothetical protein